MQQLSQLFLKENYPSGASPAFYYTCTSSPCTFIIGSAQASVSTSFLLWIIFSGVRGIEPLA